MNEELETSKEELRRAQQALQFANDRLGGIIEGTNDLIAALDADFRFIAFNRTYREEFEKIFGVKIALGMSLIDALAHLPEEQQSAMEVWGRALRGEEFIVEREFGARDRKRRYFNLRFSGLRDKDGNLIGASHIVRDVTGQREAERALRESEERLRFIIENSPDNIFIQDRELRYVWMEKPAFPMSREEILGRTDFDLLPPEEARKLAAVKEPVLREGRRVTAEIPLSFKGQEKVFEATYEPWRNGSGEIIGLAGYVRDITDRKRGEEELRRAKEMAEDATRAKSEFLANMSHEIRTPMTVILGSLEHLAQSCTEGEQVQLLEMARNAGERLLGLVSDILDLSRIESRRVEVAADPFDLRGCVEKAVRLFELKAKEKGIALRCDVSPRLPSMVKGDASRLGQILVNLVGNAVKFTDRGEVSVTAAPGEKGGEVLFRVRDTGIGIPRDKLGLLFHSFSQLDPARTRKYGGSGLGLVITKGLVEILGGTIRVESVEGEGSLFSFALPLPAVEASREVLPAGGAPPLSGRPPRILVAEDDPMVLQMLEMMLHRQPWTVVSVHNGREALDAWERGGFDLILMDVQMPEMDGFEATREIRRREGGRGGHVPIVGLTAHAGKEGEAHCREAGMDGWLPKPVGMAALHAAVEDALRRGRGGEAP